MSFADRVEALQAFFGTLPDGTQPAHVDRFGSMHVETGMKPKGTAAASSTYLSEAARAVALEARSNPQFMATDDLAMHDGTRPGGMLCIALRCTASPENATILDVSTGGDFYAPGSSYHCLTGADCSRSFSLTNLDAEHRHADMSEASEAEWAVLDEWHEKLTAKYPTVGILLPSTSKKKLGCSDIIHAQDQQTHHLAMQDLREDESWRLVE